MEPVTRGWSEQFSERLGLDASLPELDWLHALTEAFSTKVGFDTMAKVAHLRDARAEAALPLLDPEALATHWMDTNASGSCFPLTNLMAHLIAGRGLDVHIVAAKEVSDIALAQFQQIRGGLADHALCDVRVDDQRFYVDPSFLHFEPLRVWEGHWTWAGPDHSMAKAFGERILVVMRGTTAKRCIYSVGHTMDAAELAATYERAGRRAKNDKLYFCRADAEHRVIYRGGTLYRHRSDQTATSESRARPEPSDFVAWFGLSAPAAEQASAIAAVEADEEERLRLDAAGDVGAGRRAHLEVVPDTPGRELLAELVGDARTARGDAA
jgi:arylamine N-acetyltransferase